MRRIASGLLCALLVATFDVACATAADIPAKAPERLERSAYSWTGLYAGLNAGYSSTFVASQTAGEFSGGQLGYNWQMQRLVLGVEGDIQASNIRGWAEIHNIVTGSLGGYEGRRSTYFATLRGRIGFAQDA